MPLEQEQIDSLPQNLRERDQWVLWRYEDRGGKPTKVPYQPNGVLASTTSPLTWSSFDAVVAAHKGERYHGIGFVFSAGDPFVGIDLDNCFDENGTLRAWAVDIVQLAQDCECYIERTPSGRGLHLIGIGTLPGKGRKISKVAGIEGCGLEVYDRGRYFTMTGEQESLGDSGGDVSAVLEHLWRNYQLNDDNLDAFVDPGVEVDDDAAYRMTEKLLTGSSAEFRGHWAGRWDAKQYPGTSEARMGLLNKVAMSLTTDLGRHPSVAEVKAVALRSPLIQQEMRARGGRKWPRLARSECEKAVQWSRKQIVLPSDTGSSSEPATQYRLLTALEVMQQPRPRWQVRGLVQTRGLAVIYGESGSGKSFLVFDMVAAIARGVPWFGRRTRKAVCVYIGLEGSLRNRMMAYMQHHQLALDDLDCLYCIESQPVNLLTDDADAHALVAAVRAAVGDAEVGMVVVDTLNRAMPGGNENASESMGSVIKHAQVIERALNCCVGFVHHSGKDASKGARGHSSLRAATDVELEVTDSEGQRTVTATKVKDGEDGVQMHARFEVIDLGATSEHDPDAGPEERDSSLVVVPLAPGEVELPDAGKKLTKGGQDAWKAFCCAVAQHGLTDGQRRDHGINKLEQASTVSAWRSEFYGLRPLIAPMGPERKTEERNRIKAFQRAKNELIADGWLRVDEKHGIVVSSQTSEP